MHKLSSPPKQMELKAATERTAEVLKCDRGKDT